MTTAESKPRPLSIRDTARRLRDAKERALAQVRAARRKRVRGK